MKRIDASRPYRANLLRDVLATAAAAVLVMLFFPTIAWAQEVSRGKVIRVSTPTSPPAATPTPVPNPNGIYVGQVNGGYNGVLSDLGMWTLSILFERCDDCDPGQYDVYGSTYTGIRYGGGQREQGTIFGFVNPSGRTISFALLPNCALLTPSPASNNGYLGGNFGPVPGTTLTITTVDSGFGIVQRTILGRISGHDCFGKLVVADVVLTKQ